MWSVAMLWLAAAAAASLAKKRAHRQPASDGFGVKLVISRDIRCVFLVATLAACAACYADHGVRPHLLLFFTLHLYTKLCGVRLC
jgi:hypothetical protein